MILPRNPHRFAQARWFHVEFLDLSFAALSPQSERHSPLLCLRSRPSLDGGKMRASVRMTRYLESWGAAKPFANLHHRDSMTTDNGKINTTVSITLGARTCMRASSRQSLPE